MQGDGHQAGSEYFPIDQRHPRERLGQELTVPDHPELTGIALGNQDIAVITEGEIKRIGQARGNRYHPDRASIRGHDGTRCIELIHEVSL